MMETKIPVMRKGRYKQRGLAVVEFAIGLPLLILLALAVTELGRGLYQYNTLNKAVHDGARYLSDKAMNTIGVIDITGLVDETKNVVVYGTVTAGGPGDEVLKSLSTSDVSITTEFITLSDGGTADNHIKVSASYTFVPLFPALSALGYSMLPTMTASALERALKI